MRRLPKSPFESWHLKKRTATVEWPDGAAHSLPNDDHHQLVVKGGEALYHLRAWNWQNNALSLKSPQQPAIPQQQPPPAPSNINSADVLVPFDKDTAALLPCLFSLISTLCRSSIQAPPDAAAALFPFHWNCQDCKLEEHALEGIVQSLSPLAVVTSLDLSKNKVIGTEAGAEAFARALGAPSSVDEYQRALSFGHCYPHNDRLKALKLSHCPMSYNALRVYEASLPVMFPCLQRLNLSGAQLASAKCLSTIARFLGAWSLSLQELVLSNLMGSSTNKPTDATNRCWMELIRVIINLPMLETLDLSGNAIPFTARTALFSAMCSDEESKILPRLTRLHVAAATQQQQVERNDLQELRVNRPALTLIED